MSATLLDLAAPFVRAVFAIVDGGAGYDNAIAVLSAAERRFGIRIIREDRVGSLAQTWAPVDAKPTLQQFRQLMALRPRLSAISTNPAEPPSAVWFEYDRMWQRLFRTGCETDVPDRALYPFFTETSLLLCGTDFANDHWIQFPSGAVTSWTQRAWGGLLTRWALDTGWHPNQRHLWENDLGYTFFAFYLYHEISRYEEWCATVLEVIRRKCERQLNE